MSVNNSASIAGNLTADPELRITNGGTSVCEFTVAINRQRSATDAADFVRVVVFGDDAENVSNYKTKGHGVKVQGRLDHQTWTAEDGTKRSSVKLIAQKGGVGFLPRKSSISVNTVQIMGNLTRDPELVFVGDGIEKASFGLAVDGLPTGDGESETNYFDITCWRGLANIAAEYKEKGDLVHIEGRLSYSTWESNGTRRSKVEVTAENIQFLPSSDRSSDNAKANAPAKAKVAAGPAPADIDDEDDFGQFDDIPF